MLLLQKEINIGHAVNQLLDPVHWIQEPTALKFPNSLNEDFNENNIYFQVKLHPTNIWMTDEIMSKTTKKCEKRYDGPLYEDYLMLARMLNFTLVINKDKPLQFGKPEDVSVSIPFPDSPEIEKVIDDLSDVAGGGLIAYYEAAKICQISTSTYYQTGANIITIEPLKSNTIWYALFRPFAWYIWLLILSSVPLCGGVLWILRNSDKKTKKSDAIWDVAVIMLWDSIQIKKPFIRHLLSTLFLHARHIRYHYRVHGICNVVHGEDQLHISSR